MPENEWTVMAKRHVMPKGMWDTWKIELEVPEPGAYTVRRNVYSLDPVLIEILRKYVAGELPRSALEDWL